MINEKIKNFVCYKGNCVLVGGLISSHVFSLINFVIVIIFVN